MGYNLSCHVNNLSHYHRSLWIRQYELDTSMDFGIWSVPAEDKVDEVMSIILRRVEQIKIDSDCLDNF